MDYIIRAIAADNQIRAFAATTKELTEQARSMHNTSPVATAALGRLLTAGAMMGSMMKGEKDLLTLKINCSGPIGGLLVTADSLGNVKGYVKNNDVLLPPNKKGKLDVGKALDLGVLSVIKDLGLKEPYVGDINLISGEIAEDLTYYFAASEQVPSSVALGVLMNKDNTVRQAGGFIIQLMPFTDEAVIDKLEERIKGITSITDYLERGMKPEEILEEVLDGFGMTVLDKLPAAYHCGCSKERVMKALISIGRGDMQEMIDDGKPIEVNCHFCNTNYNFTTEELEDIASNRAR